MTQSSAEQHSKALHQCLKLLTTIWSPDNLYSLSYKSKTKKQPNSINLSKEFNTGLDELQPKVLSEVLPQRHPKIAIIPLLKSCYPQHFNSFFTDSMEHKLLMSIR